MACAGLLAAGVMSLGGTKAPATGANISEVQFKIPGKIPVIPGRGSSRGGSNDVMDVVNMTAKMAESTSLGREDEERMGTALSLILTNPPYAIMDDSQLTDYVTKVGLTIAAVSDVPDFEYVFGVLDRDDIAAYSAPAGFVVITRGALLAMEDESELAGVLAHEVAHIAERHGLEKVKEKKFMSAVISGAASLGEQDQALADIVDKASEETIRKGFSQKQETESDKEAVKYLMAAGYDPNGYVKFLQRMAQKQGGREKVFGTHPGLDRRVRDVRKEIGQKAGGATLKERFMKETAGLRGK